MALPPLARCLRLLLWSPVKEMLRFYSLPFHVSCSPQRRRTPPASLHRGSIKRERCSISKAFLASYVAIRVPSKRAFISRFPSQSSPREGLPVSRAHILSPSRDPHADGRATYSGVGPGSPRGAFTILLLLPLCHVAFNTTPSTSAWVDQSPVSPVSQRVT